MADIITSELPTHTLFFTMWKHFRIGDNANQLAIVDESNIWDYGLSAFVAIRDVQIGLLFLIDR